VGNNFIPIVEGEHDDPETVLALFAVTLQIVAAKVAQLVAELPDDST